MSDKPELVGATLGNGNDKLKFVGHSTVLIESAFFKPQPENFPEALTCER